MDHRYVGQHRREIYGDIFKERTMTVEMYWFDDKGKEIFFKLPAVYKVCPTCDGCGSHVNPSIDDQGLTAEDFSEDPDFKEEYMCGIYDVPCYECQGLRVVPRVDEEKIEKEGSPEAVSLLNRWRKFLEEEDLYRRQCKSERQFGA